MLKNFTDELFLNRCVSSTLLLALRPGGNTNMRLLFAAFLFIVVAANGFAKEAPVQLKDYVETAKVICVCSVTKAHDDGTVTIKVERNLKGDPAMSIRIRGETGFCVIRGPASRFMNPNRRYLVFLFKDNNVGRLGGIIEINEAGFLLIRYINGFSDTTYDKDVFAHKLLLNKALAQITAINTATR